jgi:transketolase
MAAAMNGMALHGGVVPYGGTFLIFSDYCRNAIRLSALQQVQVVYVLTHDSIGLGEDGPTHQPVEQVMSLRLIPNLNVFRPADAIETAECWTRAAGPKALGAAPDPPEPAACAPTRARTLRARAYRLGARQRAGGSDARRVRSAVALAPPRRSKRGHRRRRRLDAVPRMFDAAASGFARARSGRRCSRFRSSGVTHGWDARHRRGPHIGSTASAPRRRGRVLFKHFGFSAEASSQNFGN